MPLDWHGQMETGLGGVPHDWRVGSLGSFWTVTDCKHVTARFIEDGYPVASIREVQSRFVDLTKANQTTAQYYNVLVEGGRKPRVGDLIMSRNATVGEVAQVATWHPPFAMGQDVCLLRKRSLDLSSDYLQALFRSRIISGQLADLMVGSTFKRVNVQQIRRLVVAMPEAVEQTAIGQALSDADALIESLEQLLAKKRQVKQGAMQELLTGRKRLPGFNDAWVLKRLGDISEIAIGRTPSRANSALWGVGYKWLSISDLRSKVVTDSKEEITPLGAMAMQVIRKGTLLMSFKLSIGKLGFAGCDLYTNEAICSFTRLDASAEFLYYLLGRTDFALYGKQAVKGFTLNKASLRAIELLLPSTAEQEAIAAILSDMDDDIDALEVRVAKCRVIKQGMMQELLTGQVRLV